MFYIEVYMFLLSFIVSNGCQKIFMYISLQPESESSMIIVIKNIVRKMQIISA